MKKVDEILHAAELRLGLRFPASFAEALARYPLSELLSWNVWPPQEWKRFGQELSDREGGEPCDETDLGRLVPLAVAIGDDDGGNLLCLMARPSRPGELGEAVYAWEHDSGEFDKIANRATELDEVLELGGSAMLPSEELEPKSERYWRDRGLAARDAVCAFCRSGMEGKKACPVCGRGADEIFEEDETNRRAHQLLERMIADGSMVLCDPRGARSLVGRVAAVLDHDAPIEQRASLLASRLCDEPEVADVFASDADLVRLLRVLEG